MNEKIELSVAVINEILTYLDTRPHREVRKLIDAVHQEATASQQAKQTSTVEQIE